MIFTDQSEIQLLKQLRKQDLTIMEMGNDEEVNLQKSVEIIRYFENDTKIPEEDKKTITLYTVSSQPEAATIMDNVMGRGTETQPLAYHQTILNEYKRIAFKLLHDEPLYKYVDDKTKQLDIMIVGFGRMGQEVLKAISWAGCFPYIDTNVHVISRKAVENGKSLLSDCPELGVDLRHNSGYLTPAYGVQLNPSAPIYYYSAESTGMEFDQIIRSLTHCRYIVVSLGNDASTMETALRIYRLIMRERYLNDMHIEIPEIHVRIHSDENMQIFSSKEDRTVFSHFIQFGNNEDIYGADQVGQSELDHLAERVHNVYRSEHNLQDEMSKYAYLPEFEKNANQAAAMHVLYKLHFFDNVSMRKIEEKTSLIELEKKNQASREIFDSLASDEERERIADWEHIRWQAYMRTEGYISSPYEQMEKLFNEYDKDDWQKAVREMRGALREARIHPAIGDNEIHLKKISTLIGDPNDPLYFHKNDCRFVNSIPDIIRDIYEIIPKSASGKD